MKKIKWLVISCLMIVTLIMTSCGGGEEETVEEGKVDEGETISVTLTGRDGTSMTRTVEKPIYGGTIITALTADYN